MNTVTSGSSFYVNMCFERVCQPLNTYASQLTSAQILVCITSSRHKPYCPSTSSRTQTMDPMGAQN